MADDAPMDWRFFTPWDGVVADNEDPEGLHRVRVRIDGLVSLTPWAYPITNGGGSPQRGGHITPAKESDVVVWFVGGNPERPIYASGHWGKRKVKNDDQGVAIGGGSEMPNAARQADKTEDEAAQAHLVQILFQIGSIEAYVDERPRKGVVGKLFVIRDTDTGDHITYDMVSKGLEIKTTSSLRLLSDGILAVIAMQVQVNDRLVRATKEAI